MLNGSADLPPDQQMIHRSAFFLGAIAMGFLWGIKELIFSLLS